MTTFKYLSPLFEANGRAENLKKTIMNIAWSTRRKTTGVMCHRNIPAQLKDTVYKTTIKPAVTYGAEYWALIWKEERKLHATEMRMFRWAK